MKVNNMKPQNTLVTLSGYCLAAALLLCSTLSQAHTFQERELVCPIGGEKFKATLAASGTSFGMFLDLKPFGPIAAPWPLAKCPSNGFVIYRQNFSEEEIERLTPYVESGEYQNLQNTHTNYYVAAQIQRFLGEDAKSIADTLLKASWEAEKNYPDYAKEALAAYQALLANMPAEGEEYMTYELLCGEFERRLSLFDKAKARFLRLQALKVEKPILSKIIEFQLELINQQDNGSKIIPQEKHKPKGSAD